MRNEARGLMKKASLTLVVVIAIFIISNPCISITEGTIDWPPIPIKVWVEVSPNPAYLGDDMRINILIVSKGEEMYGMPIDCTVVICSSFDTRNAGSYSITEIPGGHMIGISSTKFLEEIMHGNSGEYEIWINVKEEQGHEIQRAGEGHFYFYNYTRPPGKPYLSLEKLLEEPEEELPRMMIRIENTGTGDARNIKIKDSLPSSFTLVSGSLNHSL